MLLVVTLDGGFIGVTAVNGDRLGEPVPANRLFQKPQCGLCVPLLREQKVNGRLCRKFSFEVIWGMLSPWDAE